MKDDKNIKKKEEVKETVQAKESNKVEDLQQKLEDIENKYKRVLADYQNLEKRSREERLEWIKSTNKDLLLRLLPVLDTLILASQHVQDKGLQVSIQQFVDTFKGEGVIKIETVGKQFDPLLMECVQTVEGQEGKVIKEVRPGYMLHDKVLRPGLVEVGKGK